jgi:photosystem II stability/assembly factor-like uncharacterized protein
MLSQWVNKHSNLPEWQTQAWAIDAIDSLIAVIAIVPQSSGSSLYATKNGGESWNPLVLNTTRWVIDVSIVDSNHIWICTANPCEIIATTDGGITWSTQYEADDTVSSFFNYIEMFDEYNGIAMGDAPFPPLGKPVCFLKTTDGGNNWLTINNPFINAASITWQNIDFINPELGFYSPSYDGSSGHSIYKTVDGGSSWQVLPDVNGYILNLKFNSGNFGFVFMHTSFPSSSGYILRTSNCGEVWDTVFTTSAAIDAGRDFEFVKDDPSKVWFCTNNNLYFSGDSGKTWSLDSLSSKFAHSSDLVVVDGKVCWFLCESVYRNLNADVVNSVDKNPTLSNDFKLNQNYPNPFNPVTTISYSIPISARVELIIYDILGNEIKTLVSEYKETGSYEVKFEASDLSSGVYFYKLKVGNFNQTKKLILLK